MCKMEFNSEVQPKKSNTNKIQTFQAILSQKCSIFISNYTLYNDLHITTINKETKKFYNRQYSKLQTTFTPS